MKCIHVTPPDNVISPAKIGRAAKFPRSHIALSTPSINSFEHSRKEKKKNIASMSASNDVYQTPLNSRYSSKSYQPFFHPANQGFNEGQNLGDISEQPLTWGCN